MNDVTESNDTLFDFPCDFPIKVMGETQQDFVDLVVNIVLHHCIEDLPDNAVTSRFSRNGKYTSVSVTIRAHSRAQLDALYSELSAHPRIKMVL